MTYRVDNMYGYNYVVDWRRERDVVRAWVRCAYHAVSDGRLTTGLKGVVRYDQRLAVPRVRR